jgi:hypothetical protein
VRVASEVPEPEKPAAETKPARKRGVPKIALIGGLAVVVFGAAAFAYFKLTAEPPPPPPKPKPAVAKIAPQPAPTTAPAASIKSPEPAAVPPPAASRVESPAPDESIADKKAVPAQAPTRANPNALKPSLTQTTLAPGVSATTELDAAPEASAAFKNFVANAKISGVFQGSPARMFINGRLARTGELVDEGLGVVFDSLDVDKRQVVFKDKSGAIVTRRY